MRALKELHIYRHVLDAFCTAFMGIGEHYSPVRHCTGVGARRLIIEVRAQHEEANIETVPGYKIAMFRL